MVIAKAYLLRESGAHRRQPGKEFGGPRYRAEGDCTLQRARQGKSAAHAPEAAFRPGVNTDSGLKLRIFVTQHNDAGTAQRGQGFTQPSGRQQTLLEIAAVD